MYGVGELSPGDGGRYAGMGNVGIAINRVGFQNTLNPAAITRMDSTCFVFDVGATAAFSYYSFLSEHSTTFTGNPNRFSLGFRMLPRWYMILGAAPYSSVGYLIYTEEEVEGMPGSYLYSSFEGSGGLYRFYLTNAYALTKNLSLGLNVGMVVGKTTQSETQESAIVEYSSKQRAFYMDLGLHYEITDSKKRNWALGVVFSPSLEIYHDNDLTYSNSSTSAEMDKTYHTRTQYLPMHIGTGLALTTNRWIATVDYNFMDWSRSSSSYTSVTYENQHKINVGATYILQPRRPRSTELMGGLGFSNSYINLKKGKMYYLEASVGATFPIRYSFLSLGATYRQQINSRSNLMQESRVSLNLNLTFGERISKSKLR
ncbi:MAG: hypothetical protein Q4D56_04755 [Bacteroides sp.]|nr:hypothetical protein [Bacteroides sp.]